MDVRFEELSERLNPIVVKEVRQGLRTRVFWVCFSLMLVACFVVSLVAYGSSLDATFTNAGRGFFYAYFFCLSAVHFFIIPYTAYRSLAREREDETWVLLSLTGLGARRIIRGKLGSYLLQALLYGSAVGPFLLFSYYLNGIDLPTILIVIALGGAYMVFLTCIAVCAATLAESRLIRGLVHFLLLGALLAATGFGLVIAGAVTFDSSRILSDHEFRLGLVAGFWMMISFGHLIYQAAASRLSLPTEDYAKGPRLALLVQIAGSIALFVCWWILDSKNHESMMIGQACLMVDLFVIGTFMLNGLEPVHEVHYAHQGWSLLRPGSPRAFRFILLLVAGVTAVTSALYGVSGNLETPPELGLYFILSAAAYVLLYLSLPIVIARVIKVWALNTAAGMRSLTLALFLAGCGMPPLFGLVVGSKPDDVALNLFNPMVGAANFGVPHHGHSVEAGYLVALVVVALVITLIADRMLFSNESASRSQRAKSRRAAPESSSSEVPVTRVANG